MEGSHKGWAIPAAARHRFKTVSRGVIGPAVFQPFLAKLEKGPFWTRNRIGGQVARTGAA